MPLVEFEARFGFRPASAIEKHYFAGMGVRPSPGTILALKAGLLGPIDTTGVVMD